MEIIRIKAMKTFFKQYIIHPAALLVLAAMGVASCSNDAEPPVDRNEEESANVTLLVNTKADATTAPNLAGEGIRTLRIIVADNNQDGVVTVNHKFTPASATDPLRQQAFTIYGLSKGSYTFYVIANEESLTGKTQTTLSQSPNGTFEANDISSIRGESLFPTIGIPEKGLPMTAVQKIIINESTSLSETIDLTYLVTKVVLNIESATAGGDLPEITAVTLENLVKQTSLFKKEYNTAPAMRSLTDNRDLPSSGTGVQTWSRTYYLNPTSLFTTHISDDNGLKIGLTAGGKTYAPQTVTDGNGTAITKQLAPNMQLNIIGKITASGSVKLTYTVEPWVTDGNESNLDYTSVVTATAGEWTGATVGNGVVQLTTNTTRAQLKFTISSPKQAIWKVSLDYDKAEVPQTNPVLLKKLGEADDTGANAVTGTVDGNEIGIEVIVPADAESMTATLKVTVTNEAMHKTWDVYLYRPEGGEQGNYSLEFHK